MYPADKQENVTPIKHLSQAFLSRNPHGTLLRSKDHCTLFSLRGVLGASSSHLPPELLLDLSFTRTTLFGKTPIIYITWL